MAAVAASLRVMERTALGSADDGQECAELDSGEGEDGEDVEDGEEDVEADVAGLVSAEDEDEEEEEGKDDDDDDEKGFVA